MADDPLLNIFGGAAADPLSSVFGTEAPKPTFDLENDPLKPKQPGALAGAVEGQSPADTQAEAEHQASIQSAAAITPAAEDTWSEIGKKWVQNLPSRAKTWVGGAIQGLAEQDKQILQNSPHLKNQVGWLGQWESALDDSITAYGKGLSARGNREQAQNAPQFGGKEDENLLFDIFSGEAPSSGSLKNYAYQIMNGFADMGAAMAVTAVTKNPEVGVGMIGAQAFGQQYDESRRMGRRPDQAFTDATFMGAAEIIGENEVLGSLMKPGKSFLGKVAKGFAMEGLQETVTQVLQTGYDKGVLHPDMTWGEAVKQVIDAGIVGGASGAGVAAVSHPFIGTEGDNPAGPATNPDDPLGRASQPKPPEPGRSYNQADAIAELGMTADEAAQFVASGKDPRPVKEALEEHGFTPGLTPDDSSSPIGDSIIIQGKDILGEALSNTGKGKLPGNILDGLLKRGLDEHLARGVSAGVFAESRGDPNALNPTSGAFGLGQWLGSRKQGLIARYGPNPTLDQQLDYLVHELNGGDAGGAAVLAAKDEASALDAYIKKFMRPAPGAETEGDIKRGTDALGGEVGPGVAGGEGSNLLGEATGDNGPLPTVEDTLRQAGIDLNADEEVTDPQPEQRVAVTRNGETVEGTVKETYGDGADKGVKIELDDGTTFDENLKAAREYGARITAVDHLGKVFGTDATAGVSVPEAAQPILAGDKIDDEFTAFHPDTGTLGIPRADMPQIKGEDRGAMVNFLAARGINATDEEVPLSGLKPTQAEFSQAKADSWDKGNLKIEDRKLLVSSDGHLLDGHHQYVKALQQNPNGTARILRLHAPIRELMTAAHAFPSSQRSEGGSQVQPDMFGGEAQTAEQMDARRFAPRALREATKADKLDDLWDATDYVLRRSEKTSSTPGDKAQSTKELSQLIGRNLTRKEATAYALELERMRDAGETGRPKTKSEKQAEKSPEDIGREDAARGYKGGPPESYTDEQKAAWQRGFDSPVSDHAAAKREANRRYADDNERRVGFIAGTRLDNSIQLKSTKQAEAYAEGAKWAGHSTAAESTAPEHATVGVDDRELAEIVTEFNNAHEAMNEGDELITHLFDPPAKGEIVRLATKSKAEGFITPKEAEARIREWEDHAVKQGQDEASRAANAEKVVLSLFDLSGEWSLPWEQAGYQVHRFDIQADPDMGDVNKFSVEHFDDWFGQFEGKDVYAILAACPCTDFASSGARHFAAKDADGRTVASVKLVHQTLATIEHFKPAIWALENPVGRIEKLGGLPPWRLSFDPNDLGDPYTKKTLIWGRFNADLPVAPVEPTEGSKMHKLYGGKSLATKNARSVTPEGFSYGFFMANNQIDHPAMAISNKYDRLDSGLIEQAVKAGITEQQIDDAVEDFYYQDLDDAAANAAIRDLIDNQPEPIADQPTEAPVNEAAAEAIRAKAQPHQDELAAWGENWGRQEGIEFVNPGLKSAARIVEKLNKEGYSSLDEIKDVARIGFKVADRNAGTDLWVSAQRKFGADNVTDKGWRMVDGDYFDRKLIISWPDGTKAEVQIIPDAIEEYRHAGGGSNLYTEWRQLNRANDPRASEVLAKMEAGYANAVAGTSWESDFNALKSASGNAFAAASSVNEGPGLDSNPGAGRQVSPDQTTAQERPSTEPSAINRSSTSNSEKSATATDVGNEGQVGNVPRTDSQSDGATFRWIRNLQNDLTSDELESVGRRLNQFKTANENDAAFAERIARSNPGESLRDAYMAAIKARKSAREYGASNKIVTRDKAEIARAIIRDKLKNQLNSGFDPELLSAGMQLAAFHLEAGARQFGAFAKAIADDLGTQAANLKPYLAAWYNGARDMLEGHGADISGMDAPEQVREALASLSTGVDGIGENEGKTNGGIATDQAAQEADRGSDAGTGAGDASGAVGSGDSGQGADGAGAGSAGQLRDSDGAGVERGAGVEPGADGSGSGQRDNAGAERSGGGSAKSSRRVRDPARGSDFRAAAGALTRVGSWKDAAERNLDIIELVNKLDTEGRPATPEEQALLAKWTGWGASEIRNKLFSSVDRRNMQINQPYAAGEWTGLIERARELVKGPDLETALQSTQYAHYTSEEVIRSVWDGLARMGFEGGRIIEPGMGIGHFFTAAPNTVADHSTYTGIELDQFTAKIAKYLLPNENIIQGDYSKQDFPDGFFDAAIGNPPFAATKILNDPAYKKMRLSLHNYFFVKTLDKVRPGGLLAFVTSRYTMDAVDPRQRQFMADRADLIGAIRLPETAFKANAGTEVVTDVLFFQRRMPGAEPGGEPWTDIATIKIDGKPANISSYFKAHPEMVLGKHALTRGMYRDGELTVLPHSSKGSLAKQLGEAMQRLPEDIYTAQVQKNVASLQAKTFERDFAPASTKEGGLYTKDGKVLVVDRGSGVPVESIHEGVKSGDHAWLKGYVKLRDLLKEAQKAQLTDASDWEAKLDALRKEYRAFTNKHGRIKEFTAYERTTKDEDGTENTVVYRRFKNQRLLFDVESPLVESLERITDAGEIEDGPFLKGRTLNKPVQPKIETVTDALAVTLDEIGKLDIGYLAKLAGRSEDEVVAELGDGIYQAPNGEWQTADEYLSGNVLQKLEEAKAAAAVNPELQRNVEALLAVQPPPLSYDKITVKLGAPWLKPETIEQFATEVLGVYRAPVTYDRATAHWNVEGANQRWARSNTSDWGTADRSPLELLDALLNNRSIKITRKVEGKEVTDADGTAAANEAAKKIADRFKTWLWEDGARTADYVDAYNRAYNNIAPRKFDGSHLTLPGLSALFKPHPHVKRAVWRIIQTGNTYLAHAVGAGKTAEQIIGGQEQRRLGLIKKPMHVVPNHMLKQFAQEFMQLYPAANIMVADEQAFHTGNRRRFLAQVALNDPDAIILTHSSFGKIDTSEDMRERVVTDMVAELETAFEDAKKEGAPRHLVSRLEKQIETLKRRFEGKALSKDKLLTFDEMGVDQIILDEAHEFRKLDFATNRSAKGIDAKGSARALDLFIKTQWLNQQNPKRGLIMASGTPVTNTMAELYTVMKFMDLPALERDGIAAFDAWANMFGEIAPGYERNAAGGYEIVERFSKFVNVPELMRRVRNFMDVLTSNELGDLVVRPKIKGNGPANIITPQSDELSHYMKVTLDSRLETSRKWKPSADQPGNPDPVINIITDARLSSIDMRFVDPKAKNDPDSKLNQMIAKIAAKHHEFAGLEYQNKDGTKQPRKGGAQIVFSPVGLGEQVSKNRGFNVREWIDGELVRLGVPKAQIGWMSDANTHAKKEQLQKDVRSGKVRVLIGSPKNMGTGLNVQDRLKVLHFLAPPWYPADVTQPHGRIERQGNQNGEIEINWYATEGTYDSTGWGMVARKQKFIDDAMAGDESVRTLEDISEANMFEMAAALAAGDDRVIRIAELGGEVERLQRLKGAHSTTQRSLRSDIETLRDFEIPRLEKRRAELQQAQAAKGGYELFSLTVNGQRFDKHGEGGEALKAAAEAAVNSTTALEKTEIGQLYGKFPVSIDSTRNGDFQLFVDVGGVSFPAGREFEKVDQLDNVGVIRTLEGAVGRISSDLQEKGREITQRQQQLEAAKAKYGAPFAEEGQLNEAIAERNRLQSEMAAETDAKNKAPADAKASALVGETEPQQFTDEQVDAFWEDSAKLVRQLLPNHQGINLHVAPSLYSNSGQKLQGYHSSSQSLIALAMDMQQEPTWVLGHESVHAMKALGLFTPTEWNLLTRQAWDNQKESYRQFIRDQWGNIGEEAHKEEAVAELFGQDFAGVQRMPPWGRKLYDRFVQFVGGLYRLGARLLNKPAEVDAVDAHKLMQRMRTGKIGSRPVGFGEAPRGGYAASPAEASAFQKWFGNSKMIDGNGAPAVWHHWTYNDFTTFDRFEILKQFKVRDPDAIDRIGFWFTDNPDARYASPQLGGKRMDAYLKIEKPLYFDDYNEGDGWHQLDRMVKLAGGAEAFRAELKSQGYDGVVISGTKLDGYNQSVAIALEPTQIKSTENRGTFDPNDPDIRASVAGNMEPAEPGFGGETEERWQEARKGIGSGASVLEKTKAWWEDLTGGFTRHWRAMPNTARFADVGQQLRKLEAAPHAALTEAVRYLKSLVSGMTADEYDLFSRKVVLDDLAWDAGEGRDLPFGFTPSTLRDARANVDTLVNLNPKLVKAVRERKAHNRDIANAMVEAGVLTREQIKNPAYFRHMVLDYARHEAALARSPSNVKSPHWARRMGSTMDINANLLEAELDWLQKARIDIETANTIEWIKKSNHNTREELRSQARADNKAALDAALSANPSAKKEDAWFRSNIARGYGLVKDALESGALDPLPPQLRGMAQDIVNGNRDGEPPFALFAHILDNNLAGAMGAGMVLKYSGLRKQWIRKLLGDSWIDADHVPSLIKHYKPEGVVAWQPKEGRHLFTAKTISESALDMFVTKLADTAAPGLDRAELAAALGAVRPQLVVGGDRYTMALPEELAATLDEFGDRRGEGMVARVFGGVQSAWKRWVLINPRRYLKYNLNNTTGDLDAVIAGKPSTLLRVGEAWRLLREAGKGNPSARYTEALDRGVFTSALSINEIPDINAFSEFKHLTDPKRGRVDHLTVSAVGKVWRALQDSTNFRESLFRLAAYLQYADEIDGGKDQLKIGYGASIPQIVDAVSDPKDRAALLARDLLGDYGAISVAGGWLRRYLIPFWSWTEINTRRYWRLTANAFTTSKGRGLATGGFVGATVAARTAVALYSRMAIVYALLYIWNHGLFGDDEDKLSKEQQAQLHLILGKDSDGNVVTLRTQGALSDVLSELGFTDALKAFNAWRDGQGSLGSVVTDMAKAPVNRVATSVTPLINEPVEQMLGQELWPDVFNPRVIHDKWRHLFQTLNVENEYDALADRPSRGYVHSWTESLVYRRNPGEMSYDEARSIAYDWLERTKGGTGGSSTSPRGEALRDYRMALRYGDQDAAQKALARYEELGGTMKTLKRSIKQAHPLGPIAKKDRQAFLDSLTDDQLQTFADAEAYWRDLYED